MRHTLALAILLLASPARAEPSPVSVSGTPGKGITLTAGDDFSLNVRSRLQLRYQLHVGPPGADGERPHDQYLTIGTLRLWLSGRALRPQLTYMIQLALAGRDYRDGATSPLFDAYVDYKVHRDLAVRAGQFFVPFDRLRTVREFALQLADRPRPVGELTLDRDTGVIVYSDHLFGDDSPVAYRAGIFGGAGTNTVLGKEPGVLAVARLELRPLGDIDDDSEGDLQRRECPAIAIGAGVAHNANTNRLRSTTGTTFTGGTVDYTHVSLDLVAKWQGLALQAEYLWKWASRDSFASAADPTLLEYTRAGRGWVVQASYVFDPPVELVGRFSRLYAEAGTDPRYIAEVRAFGQELAGGINYYLNGHALKLQADYIARTPRDASFDDVDHLVHAQLDATF